MSVSEGKEEAEEKRGKINGGGAGERGFKRGYGDEDSRVRE